MDDWISVIASSVIAGGGASLALTWLAKTWISERLKGAIQDEYAQRLETLKAQLQAETSKETERLKSNLQMAATEHQIRFSRLHERSVRTIAGTYSRLQNVYLAVSEYTKMMTFGPEPSLADRRVAVNDALKNFQSFFRPNQIWIPKDVATKVNEAAKHLFVAADQFALFVENNIEPHERTKKWLEIAERIKGTIKPILDDLEQSFRERLGVM